MTDNATPSENLSKYIVLSWRNLRGEGRGHVRLRGSEGPPTVHGRVGFADTCRGSPPPSVGA